MKHLLIALALFSATNLTAQQERTMKSCVLNEDRLIQIGLPNSYAQAENEKYPLILLTDGEWHFNMIHEASKLIYQNGGPKVIVVGINNTNRTRDLTFSNSPEDPSSGGAHDFLTYIETELLPFLKNNYRISNHRILLGHSAGGLFTTFTMVSKPDLFNAYVAVTPTIRWDDYKLLDRFVDQTFEELSQSQVAFHMSIGNEANDERKGVLKLDSVFSTIQSKEITYSFTQYSHLSHVTVPWNAYFDAMHTVYDKFFVSEDRLSSSLSDIISYYNDLGQFFDYDPKVPQRVLLNRGYELLRSNKLEEAKENFEHYASSYPNVPIPFSNLGDICLHLGQDKQAKKHYKRAYELYPTKYVESKLKEITKKESRN